MPEDCSANMDTPAARRSLGMTTAAQGRNQAGKKFKAKAKARIAVGSRTPSGASADAHTVNNTLATWLQQDGPNDKTAATVDTTGGHESTLAVDASVDSACDDSYGYTIAFEQHGVGVFWHPARPNALY